MKNILILDDDSEVLRIPFHSCFSDGEARLFLITQRACELENQRPFYAEIIKTRSLSEHGLLEYYTEQIWRRNGLDALVNTGEGLLLRSGRLRDILNIFGQSYSSALLFRDKLLMRQHAVAAKIPAPHFCSVQTPIDIIRFIQEHGYPVIIKRKLGSASQGSHLLRNEANLLSFLDLYDTGREFHERYGEYIAEQYIDGEVFHVNGFISHGQVHCIWPFAYYNSGLLYTIGIPTGYYPLSVTNPLTEPLIRFAHRVLSSFPTPPDTFFHIEILQSKSDELFLCEAASRRPGGLIMRMMDDMYALDPPNLLFRTQVRQLAGLPPETAFAPYESLVTESAKLRWRRPYGDLFVPVLPGLLRRAPSICPIPDVVYSLVAKPGQTYRPADMWPRRAAHMMVYGDSEQAIRVRMAEAAQWFAAESQWEA